MVVMRKGKQVGSLRVVATHKVVLARSDMSGCHLDGCWLLYVLHTSSVISCCSLTECVRFVLNKPTAVLLCSWIMPTNNAPPQRTDEHRNTVVGEKIPHHWAKAESCFKNKLQQKLKAPPELKAIIRNKIGPTRCGTSSSHLPLL
ncbi:unnamed protein product [Heterosigma akashiwo]